MTFAQSSPPARTSVANEPASVTRRVGRTALFGVGALLAAGGGLIAGTSFETSRPDSLRLGTKLDQVEARIQSLEFETVHDGGAERFRAARALIVDLGKEIDTLRYEASERQARLESRIDRLEKQTSADLPTASIAVGASIDTTAPLIPPPAPALPAIAPSAAPDRVAAVAGEPARTSPDYRVAEIYRGQAIVEGSAGIWRVGIGDSLPGLGRVEAIEPRGKAWAVVTTGGTVTSRED